MEDLNDFNSRTHVECDPSLWNADRFLDISTHALTWSATTGSTDAMDAQAISTHALTWSATLHLVCGKGKEVISTHALTWSATEYGEKLTIGAKISTHALTWSATCKNDDSNHLS